MRGAILRRAGVLAFAAAALLGAACGGERQDADEPSGEFKVDVVSASFPAKQSVAQRSTMAIRVRNADDEAIPNLSVTIETDPGTKGEAPIAFGQRVDDSTLADPGRPIWIVDRGPQGGDTAYTNTWSLGRVEPGQSKTFEWRVTAVQPGSYRIGYRVSPGLDGKARLASGSTRANGSFAVKIDDEPAQARVNDQGEVVREGE